MCHPKLTLVKAGDPFNGVDEMNRVVVASLVCEMASSVRLTLSVTSKGDDAVAEGLGTVLGCGVEQSTG